MENSGANGFSLVEVIVAIVVLSVGMLAMAASTGYIAAEVRSSTFETQRAVARRQVIEELRAIPFDSVKTSLSPRTVGRYQLEWRVASVNTNLKSVLVIANGPAVRRASGGRQTVEDTAFVQIARP